MKWLLSRKLIIALSRIFRATGAALRPKNLKNALRSVTFNRKEYLCFFLAMTVIIVGFAVSTLSLDADLSFTKHEILDNYDYHLTVSVPETYASDIHNALLLALERKDVYIQDVHSQQEVDGSYTFYITGYNTLFGGVREDAPDAQSGAKDLLTHVKGDIIYRYAGVYTVRTSPLYEWSTYRAQYLRAFWGLTLGWLLLSVIVLTVLYLIRLDHFRFTYGMYLACGADFTMLYGTAAGELLAVGALVLLPAVLLGGGLSALLCALRGIPFALSVRSVVVTLLAPVLTVLISVWFPMRSMAKTPPIRLLTAKDNAGLVSSPRRSVRLFGNGFPGKYELVTMWRMRKYYARLVISAVLFAALFISGLYISEMQDTQADIAAYEYLIRYTPTTGSETETDDAGAVILPTLDPDTRDMVRTDADLFLDEINALPGVDYVWWNTIRPMNYMQDHLLLSAGQLTAKGNGFRVPSDERKSQGYTSAVNNVGYTAVDEAWIRMLSDNGLCTIDGDPYAVLTNDRMVILTENAYNEQAYRFNPGDTVMLAEFNTRTGRDLVNFDPQSVLSEQIKNCTFTYTEYTVAAVIRGMTSEYDITFGVNFNEFERLTDGSVARDTFRVYMENGTDYGTVHAAESQIRKTLLPLTGWTVEPTGNYFRATVKASGNQSGLSLTLGILLLLISPLVWLFSQIMYYRQRREEYGMLYALGAPKGSVATLHRLAGGVLSGLAFLATILLSLLSNYAVFLLVTVFLPKMHLTEAFAYEYRLSVPALIACVVASVVCGFLSCEIPYRLFGRKPYARRRDD